MKKLLLLLITLTTLIHISYASFPVNQDAQTEIVETIESTSYRNSLPILGILSLILSAPARRVSPVPSFADEPIPTVCFAISYPSSNVSDVESKVTEVLSNLGAEVVTETVTLPTDPVAETPVTRSSESVGLTTTEPT